MKEKGPWSRSNGNDLCSYCVSTGRISSLQSIPAQVKLNELQEILSEELSYDMVLVELEHEFQAVGFQNVCCYDTEGQVEQYLQFHVPKNMKNCSLNTVSFMSLPSSLSMGYPFCRSFPREEGRQLKSPCMIIGSVRLLLPQEQKWIESIILHLQKRTLLLSRESAT